MRCTRAFPSLIVALASLAFSTVLHAADPPASTTQVPRSDLLLYLTRLGAEPQALTAGGASIEQMRAIVEKARSHIAAHGSALRQTETACAAARARVKRLESPTSASPSPDTREQQLATARAELVVAEATLDAGLAALADAMYEGLPTELRARVERVHKGRRSGLPLHFLVIDRSTESAAELRSAWATLASAPESDPARATAAAVVASAEGHSEVSSAKQRLSAHLGAMKTAWTAATQ